MPVQPTAAFLAGLVDRVAVERDGNADASRRTRHGAAPPDYRPVPGLLSVACRLVLKGRETRTVAGREVPVLSWRVLLGEAIPLDPTYRLAWHDPDLGGQVRHLHPSAGAARYPNAGGMYAAADCLEYLPPAPAG